MIPADAKNLDDALRAVLFNCAHFDWAPWQAMLATQPDDVRRLSTRFPPDRVYLAHHRGKPVVSVVVGYRTAWRGEPAQVGVHLLGVTVGQGSPQLPLLVYPEQLQDVTEEARRGLVRPDAG